MIVSKVKLFNVGNTRLFCQLGVWVSIGTGILDVAYLACGRIQMASEARQPRVDLPHINL